MVATKFSQLTPADFDAISELHSQELHMADEANYFDDLDSLTQTELVGAESKLIGQTLDNRCKAVASILGIPAQDLAMLTMWWLSKLPSNDVNRWIDRDDVEQRIYVKLLRSTNAKGNWDMCKQEVKCAYLNWYRSFRRDRSIGEYQAMSLDREAFQTDVDGESLADYVVARVDYLAEIDDYLFTDAVMVALPKPIAKVVAMRLSDTPTTATERSRLKRFLAHKENVQGILGLLNGTLTRKPVWIGATAS